MTFLLPREKPPIRPKKWHCRAPLRPRQPRDEIMYPNAPYTVPGGSPSGFGCRRDGPPAGIVKGRRCRGAGIATESLPEKNRARRLQECPGPLAGQTPIAGMVTAWEKMPLLEKPSLGKTGKIAKKHDVSSKNAPILAISRRKRTNAYHWLLYKRSVLTLFVLNAGTSSPTNQ